MPHVMGQCTNYSAAVHQRTHTTLCLRGCDEMPPLPTAPYMQQCTKESPLLTAPHRSSEA